MEPDPLFSLKNHFFIGNFQMAINEGSTLHLTSDVAKMERDTYVYRAYIAAGQAHVALDEIKDAASTPMDLQAVKLLATYVSNPDSREVAVLTASQWLTEPDTASNHTMQLIAATILVHEEKFAEALKAVKGLNNLEQLALAVQVCIKLNRLDVAQDHLKKMQSLDDESTLTQLATAWLYLCQGGDKYLEASYLFQEQIDKFGASVVLLNGLASAKICMGQFDDAEKLLIDAIGKSANDPDTLANLVCCAQHTGKPAEFVQRYMNQLKRAHPTHATTEKLAGLENMFERSAAQFAL
jgi:coatomer protein complex subunit epsilon